MKKSGKIAMIAAPIVCACIAFVIVLATVIIPSQKLKKANILMESGNYEAAYKLLEEANHEDLIAESKYNRSIAMIESGDYEEAYMLLEGIDYKDSEIKRQKISERIQLMSDLLSCRIGDKVCFGTYVQSYDASNGPEDIEWIVLDRKNNAALLISKYALDCKPYNTEWCNITWETCSLREWLNNDFMNAAFSEDEQAIILVSSVSADKNPEYQKYPRNPGNATQDRIFLLSIPEVYQYFVSTSDGVCWPTEYAVRNGASAYGTGCWWWLRSPGYHQNLAADVKWDGSVYKEGHIVSTCNEAVRPALWINLES